MASETPIAAEEAKILRFMRFSRDENPGRSSLVRTAPPSTLYGGPSEAFPSTKSDAAAPARCRAQRRRHHPSGEAADIDSEHSDQLTSRHCTTGTMYAQSNWFAL
jgi:hypothetical protein